MDPWLITGGVAGSEPTNLVFCRYFERPTQFFYQSSKEWAQGGEGGPSARSGVGRLRESGEFVVATICLLFWDKNELLISCVQRSGWCEQDVFASTGNESATK